MTHLCTHNLETTEGKWSRRRVLTLGCLAVAANLMPRPILAHVRRRATHERTLSLHNLHTGESLETVYCIHGKYLPEALADISHILRDHRSNEIRPIDPKLLDLLFAMHQRLNARRPFHIISGYRSAATNAMLRQRSKGVAKHSLHIQGKAVDIRLPGRSLASLRRAAVTLRCGGVGYYPRSKFVHLDTGKVRYW